MKRPEKPRKKAHNAPAKRLYAVYFFMATLLALNLPARGQVRQLIQVKTFDQQLQPMKDVEVSINEKDYISTGSKGVIFVELSEHELPVRTIRIRDEKFEPAAWNYSKSILEIVVRRKNYKLARVVVKDTRHVPLANLPVTFKGKKTTTATTNADGKIEIPLALDEKITSAGQFTLSGYETVDIQLSERESVLTVERARPVAAAQEGPAAADLQKPVTKQEYLKDFDLSMLDSIESLTMFYAIFKNHDIKNMSDDIKAKLDARFNELVLQLQDSIMRSEDLFMGSISDSSFVSDDIRNLITQARTEGQMLSVQRDDFDEKIEIINEKLEKGLTSLDEDARALLLADLLALEQLLTENENRFYRNLNYYRQIINSLKERYFDFQHLENKLSESEARRLEEQRVFRQRLIGISAVVIAFAILIVLLIRFSGRLRKQKKALVVANAEIKRINENLEAIVKDRTKLLEEANRELDTFLYRASHDLRSPVCSIIGLCNLAVHLSEGEPQELVKRVANTTEGMDRLLKKLSIISEINQPTGYSSIILLDIVENVQHKLGNVTGENRAAFQVDCPADLVFYSYPNLLEVVIANLLENALFYSMMRDPQNARVSFEATINDGRLEFSVYDNGIGVDDTIRHRLFDMFFKGHPDSRGNGLGLYIVQKSVQALEGHIAVESEKEQYTRFVVQLPLNTVPKGKEQEPVVL